MFRSLDDHLQKDLFVNMLETTITMSYKYCGVPLKTGLYLNQSGRPFLDNGSVTRFPVSLPR
jgi:hypothetical protein